MQFVLANKDQILIPFPQNLEFMVGSGVDRLEAAFYEVLSSSLLLRERLLDNKLT